MSRHRTSRRLAYLTAALCTLLLAWPSTGAAQQDILGELQSMEDIFLYLAHSSNPDSVFSNLRTVGIQDGFNEPDLGAPLTWNGTHFSMHYALEEYDWQYGTWSFEGEVAPDGQSILELSASLDIHYCTNPSCYEPSDHEQAAYKLRGPIPLVGTEDHPWNDAGWCYKYQVTGDDVPSVIEEAYPPSSSVPVRVEVLFCTASAATGPQPTLTPAATGFWQFVSREIIDVNSPKHEEIFGPCQSLGDTSWGEWGFETVVEEATAATRIEVERELSQDCQGPGCPSVVLAASFRWTPPPRILVPGERVPLSAAITDISFSEEYYGFARSARLVLKEDLSSTGTDSSQLLWVQYHEDAGDSAILNQDYERQWEIPPGGPGDGLIFRVEINGPSNCDGSEIHYHYQYIVVEKTAEPGVAAPPDDAAPYEEDDIWVPPSDTDPDDAVPGEEDDIWVPPSDTDPDDPAPGEEDDIWVPPVSDISDEDWAAIVAGFEDIGRIPGPEGLTEVLVGVGLPTAVISVLTALGYLSGAEIGGGETPPPGSAPHVTMTDALGNRFDYDWSPELGGYINPQTGGMLDPTLWNEYNQNVAPNRAFSDRERQRLENRDTSFDRQVDWYNTDSQRERRQGLEGALRTLEERGYGLGEDGARASAHAAELARQTRAGLPVSIPKAMSIERFLNNREAGRSTADTGERREVTDWDVYKEQALGGARGIITGRNKDGSTNWAGIGVRIGIGVLTGGSSEKVFIPASAAYVYADSRAQGLTRTESVGWAAGSAILEVGLGKAAQGLGSLGGRALGTAGQFADEMAPGLSNYVRTGVQGLRQEFGQLGRGAASGLSSAKQAVARRLGIGTQPALSAAERQVQWRITKAIAEGADDDIARVFRGGGRQTVASLEANGGLTPQQAGRIRQALSNQVDDALDDGAASAMQRFQARTGIQPEEVLVGDSGSTARGGAFSVANSDFDRTVVPRFAASDIERFATENHISPQQANEVLSRRYRAIYQREVDRAINQRTGLTPQEIDLNIFDRIRPGTGRGQTYASGYTNARQSAWGRTRVYRPGQRPYTTSGDALVDENALGIGRATGTVPTDPTRMNATEFRSVVRQQLASGNRNNDATSLAKALDRAREPARRLGVRGDSNLGRIARLIRNNPQQQAAILSSNGMTEAQFVQQSRQELTALAQLSGM